MSFDANAQENGPLAGYTVIDLSRALAGPHATMMLGDLGAQIIKVESTNGGDDTRGWGPPFVGPEEDRQSTYFLSCNRNKRSIVLNLKSADGFETLRSMIKKADVLVENFRPGVMDRLGLTTQLLHEINPKLVMLSISGFGHDGPEAARSGYDQILQGEAGLMSLTGPSADDPQKVGVPIGDLLAGMYGAYGVLAALLERERTGLGQQVRTSLLAAIVGVHAFQGTRNTVAGQVPKAQGNHHPSIAPYGLFRSADGFVQISVGSPKLWQALVEKFQLPTAGFESNAQRVERREELIAIIEKVFMQIPTQPLLKQLGEAGIPAGIVRTLDEVYEWDQVRSQGLVLQVQHPVLGQVELPGAPLRFFDGKHEVSRKEHTAPPLLNQHEQEIREWLGQDAAQVAT
ncbi:CoA transferase [Arthrobacter sp. MYb211]|uniref:CaiB/BaiF CoA transferase family protein n=1 Tax=unclassified Arthrobacter TaxID=235627 RepID=UPI000CFB36E2|nr:MULTISPECIES: CoA transferase [unclassified Arthrobacter]PRA10033.1 CoA transferase [Arthrobacter sp. MYb221]PRC05225.1 CoA transferase [Arthrobacter sp. MYb211]